MKMPDVIYADFMEGHDWIGMWCHYRAIDAEVTYIRKDLIPQWRPIGAWSKVMGEEWCDFIRRKPNSLEWVRCERQKATHFMQLTPPERNQ